MHHLFQKPRAALHSQNTIPGAIRDLKPAIFDMAGKKESSVKTGKNFIPSMVSPSDVFQAGHWIFIWYKTEGIQAADSVASYGTLLL